MAIISVKEQHQRRRSTYNDGKILHVRVWQVTTSDIRDGTAAALVAPGIPIPNELWPGTLHVRVTRIDVQPVQNTGVIFEVQVEWNSVDPSSDKDDVHPLDRPPEFSWGATETTEPYFMDRSPTPKRVVNTSGDSFEQFLQREDGELVAVMVRNEATFDASDLDTYSHTVNNELITLDGNLFTETQLKLSPVTAVRTVEVVTINGQEEEVTYYKVRYEWRAKREGWRDKVLDVGFNELIVRIENVNGTPTPVKHLIPIIEKETALRVTHPYPLDGTGHKKANPDDPPAELEFRAYEEKSWAPLYLR
jgi:hypothetical protein